jgi:hypothetical protein
VSNERPTPETDEFNCKWDSYSHPFQAIDLARKLERERDEARINTQKSKAYKKVLKVTNANLKNERDKAQDALMKIEEIFVDGENTHDDWFKMGSIAIEYFKK